MTTRTSVAILTVIAAFSSSVGTAAAAGPAVAPLGTNTAKAAEAEAVAHFRRGVELYEENDFNAAIVEFKRAYETAPNPRVLYNIGQTYYQLQNYAVALETFERYLKEAGSAVSGDRRKEVEADIAKLQSRVAKATLTVNVAGADLYVDETPVGKSPIDLPVTISMGRRKITASKPGFVTASRSVDFAGGDATKVVLELTAERKETRDPARVTSSSEGFPLAIPWAGAGVLAAGAVTTGILALSASSDAKEREGRFGETRASLDDAQSKAQNLALATDILAGATIALAGVSLYLTLTRSKAPRAESPRANAFVVTPRGAVIVGQF